MLTNLHRTQRVALAWMAALGVTTLVLWLLAPVLAPFIIGAIAAYALHPLVEMLARRRVPRALAVVGVILLALCVLLALVLLVVPILTRELPLLRQQLPDLAERINQTLVPWLAQFGLKTSLDVDSIRKFIVTYLDANFEDLIKAALTSVRIGSSFVLTIIGNLFLMPVVLFYLLYDWPDLVEKAQSLIPPRWRQNVEDFLDDCDATLGQYLRGQVAVMLAMAVFYSVGLALGGLDLAVPVGVFTGMSMFIPYLGFGLGLVLALIAAVLQFSLLKALLVVGVVYGAGQVLESMVLTPRLVGERIGMSALGVIFAMLAFGHLLGFVGVLIALPASAVAQVALRRLLAWYRRSEMFAG